MLNPVLSINYVKIISISAATIYVMTYFATEFHRKAAKPRAQKNVVWKDSSAKSIELTCPPVLDLLCNCNPTTGL